MHGLKIAVLVAEDDENDAILLKRAFGQVNSDVIVHIVPDGGEAIAYLKGGGKYADREAYPFPQVLITDLKMPRVNGFELLTWLRDHPECSVTPTVVLSASKLPEDVKKAYALSVNVFFQKPAEFDGLIRLIELNFRYWQAAERPTPDPTKRCG